LHFRSQTYLHASHGHGNHITSLRLIQLACKGHIIHPSIPPHRWHPLDVSFMGPLNQQYPDETRKWLWMHPDSDLTMKQVTMLRGPTYMKPSPANDFWQLWPAKEIQTFLFGNWMFQLSKTTDWPIADVTPFMVNGCDDPSFPLLRDFKDFPAVRWLNCKNS
jgi:hypothetical protein